MTSRTTFFATAVLVLVAATVRSGEIRGRLLVDGRPAAGITVSVRPFEDGFEQARREARGEDQPKPLTEGQTRKDGRFRLTLDTSAAPSDTPVRIDFSGEKSAPRRLVRLVDPGGEDVGDVRLASPRPLAGRVQDARGGPVVGATVRLWAGQGGRPGDDLTPVEPVPQTVTTGADGTFRFEAASDTGNGLRVEALAMASAERRGAPGGALARPVTLALGRVLRGTVTLPDRRTPAGGAVVRFEGRSITRWHEVRADGSFLIEGVPATEAGQVVADAGDRGRAAVPVTADVPEVQVILAPNAALSGRVVDAHTGRPVAGVRLVVKAQGGAAFLARSGRAGRYAFPGLPPRSYRLEVDDPRFVRWSREVDVAAGQSGTQDVPLVPGATLVGRVTDEDSRPVEGATVQLLRGGGRGPRDFFRRMRIRPERVRTARDGTFEATRLEPGSGQRLDVRHPDYASRSLGGIDLAPGATTAGLRVVLRAGLELQGVVNDQEGRPLPGVEIELQRPRTFRGRGGLMSVTMMRPGDRPQAGTGADGRFVFRGLEAGDYTLTAKLAGYGRAVLDPVKLLEGGVLEPVELVMAPGATISGFLRDGSGNGASGWMVSARQAGESGRRAFGPGALRTEEPSGSDGAFLLEGLAEGETYDLQVMGPAGLGPRRADVTAPADDVEITVTGAGQIRGRVAEAESGGPVADFEVLYRQDARGGVRFFFGGGRGGPGRPRPFHAEDGGYLLDEVPAGRWTVEVRAEGYQPGTVSGVVVEEGQSTEGIDIALSKGGTISGQVLESRSGSPILDATVRVELSGRGRGLPRIMGGGENEAMTDAEGRYEVTGLAPGTWSVTASHPDWSEATVSVELEDAPATADLRLGRGASIGGVVLAAGRPVAGAEVGLAEAGEAGFRGIGGEARLTGEDGRFRFERLTPGRYTLSASLRSQSSSPVEAVVTGEAAQEVTLTLSEGAAVHGTVSGLPESQLPGVQVTASGSDGYFASARVDAGGIFELTGVPEGVVSLRATAGDFATSTRTANGSVTIGPGQTEAFAEIVFEAGYLVEVHLSRSGQPVADGFVTARPEFGGGRSASGRTDEMGFCRLEGLQEGTYDFIANVQGGAPVQETVAISGDTTVDIEIPPARIAGAVVDTGTGQPLAEVSVRLEEGGAGFRFFNTASSDSTGRFALEDLEPRAYRLTFQKPAYETETREATAAEDTDLRVEMRRGEGLGLVALDALFGTPLRGLMVRVVDANGIAVFSGTVPLDSQGRGEVPSVKPGSYEIRASSSGYAPVVRPGVMAPSSGLTLGFTPGGTLEILAGPETLALPQPRGRLYQADGRPYLPSIFSTDGVIALRGAVRRLENVTPGRYVFTVEGGARQEMEVREGGVTSVALP